MVCISSLLMHSLVLMMLNVLYDRVKALMNAEKEKSCEWVCVWHSFSFPFLACRLEACSNSVGSVCPTEGIYMRLQGSWWPIWRKLFREELSPALSGPRQQRTQQWNQPIIALPEDLACLSPPPACKHWQHTAWGKARRSCLEGKKMADKSTTRVSAALSTCQGRERWRRFVFWEYAWIYCAKCAVTEDVSAYLKSERVLANITVCGPNQVRVWWGLV